MANLETICPHNCKDCYAMRVCAIRAIVDQEGSIFVNHDECIGCGCCKAACEEFGYKALHSRTEKWLMGA